MVGVPARVVRIGGRRPTGQLDHVHIPDPVAQEICKLNIQISRMEKRLRFPNVGCRFPFSLPVPPSVTP